MSKTCVFCSAVLDDGAKFCNVCGKPADTAVPVKTTEETAENIAEEKVSDTESGEISVISEETVSADTNEENIETTADAENAEETDTEEKDASKELPFVPEIADTAEPVSDNAADTSEETEQKTKKDKKEKKEKREKTPKAPSKVTFLGSVCAVFLSLLLILNTAIIFSCSLGLGVSTGDIYNYRFDIGNGDTFAFSDIKNSEFRLPEESQDIISTILDTIDGLKFALGDTGFTLDFSENSRSLLETVMQNSDRYEELTQQYLLSAQYFFSILMMSIGGYVIITTIVFILALFASLAKKRSSFLIPGITFMILGLCGMGFVLCASFMPHIIGIASITSLFTLDSVIMTTLITTAAFSVIGVLLVAIGSTGKKN